jgi:hypothetical protein
MRDLRRIDKPDAKSEAAEARRDLAALRDDLRVRIHLGGMELRDAFDKLEREADRLAAKVPPAATRVLRELAVRLRRIAHALDGKQ